MQEYEEVTGNYNRKYLICKVFILISVKQQTDLMHGYNAKIVNMSNRCTLAVPRDKYWMKTHEEYVKKVRKSNCDVVFIGDSIIQYMEASCIWHDFLASCSCINLGIGGDRVEHVLWRIQNGELSFENQIKAVVLLVGTNNVDCSAENIFEGILNLIKEIRARLGKVTVILPSLLPKGQYPNPYRQKNQIVNKLLEERFDEEQKTEETRDIYFVPIGQHILEKDDTISDTHLYDYLHLTDIGYLKTFVFVLDKLKELGIAK